MKNKPVNFFVENSKYSFNEIESCNFIHKGFTNESYLLITNDKLKWQIRFTGLNDVVNRKNEKEVLNLINDKNYIYYDGEGNSIKKWIKGKNLSLIINKRKKLKLICNKINNLHKIDISNNKNIIVNDYLLYLNKVDNFNIDFKKKYIELVNKYKYLDKVLSHNDLSPANIIYNANDIFFIDYEWSRINDNYFDIANFIRESNLSLKWLIFFSNNLNNIEIDILKDFIFIVTCFAFQWTFIAKQDENIFKYRRKCLKKMNYLYKKLNYNNIG